MPYSPRFSVRSKRSIDKLGVLGCLASQPEAPPLDCERLIRSLTITDTARRLPTPCRRRIRTRQGLNHERGRPRFRNRGFGQHERAAAAIAPFAPSNTKAVARHRTAAGYPKTRRHAVGNGRVEICRAIELLVTHFDFEKAVRPTTNLPSLDRASDGPQSSSVSEVSLWLLLAGCLHSPNIRGFRSQLRRLQPKLRSSNGEPGSRHAWPGETEREHVLRDPRRG